MSLTIDTSALRCRMPCGSSLDDALLARVARDVFPGACARRLRQRWPARPEVCRIRELSVRLEVSASELGEQPLAEAWAAAFSAAVLAALSSPRGFGGPEMARAPSRAAWLARVLRDLLAGSAAGRWEYEEFSDALALGARRGALHILLAEPAEIAGVLMLLAEGGPASLLAPGSELERLLNLFDELDLERLFQAMSPKAGGGGEPALSFREVLTIGRLAAIARVPLARGAAADRRASLRFFLWLRREQPSAAPRSPRRVLRVLEILAAFLADPEGGLPELAGEAALATEVKALLVELRPLAPSSLTETAADPAVGSPFAGIFLLVGQLERLGWPEAIAFAHGPNALRCVLAGLAMAVLGRFEDAPEGLDPALSLFAGWGEVPDLDGLRRFLATDNPGLRRDLLEDLLKETTAAETWSATFDLLAETLIRHFAERLRGFRRSSRGFVVRGFLALPGRVQVGDKQLKVHLEPCPYQVVLHIAGADEALGPVGWLGGRRLEIRLEGL